MFSPGHERQARDNDMQKLLHAGQHKWDDDAYLGIWGQLCQVWAYDAFDAADDWWVQWGVLRERATCLQEPAAYLQDPNVQLPWSRLEIRVSAQTGYD